MDRSKLIDLVEGSDVDGLVRFVDAVCAAREWDGLVEVRERCKEAENRGKQLFGIAQFADYRLALEAPGELAASVLADGAGRFTLGPLWEVAASTHTWEELDPHLSSSRMRALIATERSMRGDDLDSVVIDLDVLGTPMLRSWEPSYSLATYRSDAADFPAPEPALMDHVPAGAPGELVEDLESEEALYALGRTWAEESNGSAAAVSVRGTAAEAVVALAGIDAMWSVVSFDVALAHMAWTGASGGAHGSRRGAAVGRAAAWAAVAAVGDLDWVPDAEDFQAFGESARWHLWTPTDRVGGWGLGLAVEHRAEGYAWALWAHDVADDDDAGRADG